MSPTDHERDAVDELSHLFRTGVLGKEQNWREQVRIIRECPYRGMPGASCKDDSDEPKRETE